VSQSTSSDAIPRGVLIAAAVLIGLSILAAGAARWTGVGTTDNPSGDAVDRLALRFEDRPDGAVAVFAAGDDRQVEVLAPGSNGFVRGVLRGLARERRARGVGSEPAFHLTRWADGRLSLDDPATGRTIELGAFGPTNAGVFATLFATGKGTQ
jgi:putative photosynthetic complex assembly protein